MSGARWLNSSDSDAAEPACAAMCTGPHCSLHTTVVSAPTLSSHRTTSGRWYAAAT